MIHTKHSSHLFNNNLSRGLLCIMTGKDKGKDGNGSAMVVDGDHQSNLPIDDSEAEAHRQLHLLVDDSEQCLLALRALLRFALFLQCDLPSAPSGNALASRYCVMTNNYLYCYC